MSAKQGRKGLRTKGGSPSVIARKKYGMKSSTARPGSFPIFDMESAISALRLRGHARTRKDRLNIINRARKFAPKRAATAYKADKKAKII